MSELDDCTVLVRAKQVGSLECGASMVEYAIGLSALLLVILAGAIGFGALVGAYTDRSVETVHTMAPCLWDSEGNPMGLDGSPASPDECY